MHYLVGLLIVLYSWFQISERNIWTNSMVLFCQMNLLLSLQNWSMDRKSRWSLSYVLFLDGWLSPSLPCHLNVAYQMCRWCPFHSGIITFQYERDTENINPCLKSSLLFPLWYSAWNQDFTAEPFVRNASCHWIRTSVFRDLPTSFWTTAYRFIRNGSSAVWRGHNLDCFRL